MDDKDIIIKSLLSRMNDQRVDSSFLLEIESKIKREEEKRAKLKESIQTILILVFLTAIFICVLFLYGKSDAISFDILKRVKPSIIGIGDKIAALFSHGSSFLWIVVSTNSALLLLIQTFIHSRFSKRGKKQ